MAINGPAKYDGDLHVAEIYDTQWETEAKEAEDIREYTAGRGPLRVLDPFCGTGRILLPLACAGHALVGMDQCRGFLARLRGKLAYFPEEAQRRVTLIETDSVATTWPTGFDVVFMGGNCLWELATAEEQDRVIASAAAALELGGHLYLDNDLVEGDLPESWQRPGIRWSAPFTCADGTRLEVGSETLWYDAPGRLHRGRRVTRVTSPDGQVMESETVVQRHLTNLAEMQGWLAAHGFVPEHAVEAPDRATYWARRERL